MVMAKARVQGIVIQDCRVLFASGRGMHSFIGGGLEENEAPEQGVLRELREEANVSGTILFRLSDLRSDQVERQGSFYGSHPTFLVDIGDQVPVLGDDPEQRDVAIQDRHLVGLEFILLNRPEAFTAIDIEYFEQLIGDCKSRGASFLWLEGMEALVRPKLRAGGESDA